MNSASLETTLTSWVDRNADRLVGILGDLVRIPSENTPPSGAELACQEYIASFLRTCGWEPDLYRFDEVPGLREHPLFWPGRDYKNRPNLGARMRGSGEGPFVIVVSAHRHGAARHSALDPRSIWRPD